MTRLRPETSLLLVVDLQERLMPAMEEGARARLGRSVDVLLEAARLLRVPTLATEQYPKGLGATAQPFAAQLEAIGVAPVSKLVFSAAEVPEIARAIAKLAPRAIVVVGVEAHVCVLQTVRDLVSRGHEVHVPHDGVASRSPLDREAALRAMERLGAWPTSSESVVFDWLHEASGDAFKAMSKKLR
jgi:nicotinamidase-related amidase